VTRVPASERLVLGELKMRRHRAAAIGLLAPEAKQDATRHRSPVLHIPAIARVELAREVLALVDRDALGGEQSQNIRVPEDRVHALTRETERKVLLLRGLLDRHVGLTEPLVAAVAIRKCGVRLEDDVCG